MEWWRAGVGAYALLRCGLLLSTWLLVAVPSSRTPAPPLGACDRWGARTQAPSLGQDCGRARVCRESVSSFQNESGTC